MKYRLILADPPWEYDNKQQNDPARGGVPFHTLSMIDLAGLPMSNIAEDDSILVCWVTWPKLCDQYYERYDPLSVIRSWGFRPVTALFVWVKTKKRVGAIEAVEDIENPEDLYSGLGRYTNSNSEFAIVARRGKGIPRLARDVKQVILSPIGEHSAKPEEQYARLFKLYGDIPRIELFARKKNPPPVGWAATGLEWDGVDIREYLTGTVENDKG